MTFLIWILLAGALAFGGLRYIKHRGAREADVKTRAEKRAKLLRDDAQAMKRTLNGRR